MISFRLMSAQRFVNRRLALPLPILMLAAVSLALCVIPGSAGAVMLDSQNRVTLTMNDGSQIVLYGRYISKIGARGLDDGMDGLSSTARPAPLDVRNLKAVSSVSTRATVGETAAAAQAALRENYKAPGFSEYQKSSEYYYLPPSNSLRLAKRADGDPEFLFVKYTTEETESAGGAQGGLFHLLMEVGLTKEQEKQIEKELQKKVPGAKLAGAAEIEEFDEKGSFKIISAILSDDKMKRSLVQTGHAPTLPGGRLAAAGNLSSTGAQLFLATVESGSVADLSIELDYAYNVMIPGSKGEIIFHWDRLKTMVDTSSKTRKDEGGGDPLRWIVDVRRVSENEVAETYNSMVENNVVELKYESGSPGNEYDKVIIDAMLEFFKNSLLRPAEEIDFSDDDDEEEEDDEQDPDKAKSGAIYSNRQWVVNKSAMDSAFQAKTQRVRLDFGLTVRRPFQVVGNLLHWYDANKDNENCVQSVNLNDPFFQHREVRFIIDLEAKEIFEDVVNYVTVNVRKRRKEGNDFQKSVTIDQDYLKEKGVAASMTYARMDDKSSEAYEYMSQWSIKGGNLYPAKGRWRTGKWEGVTLAPPIERWNIEVEGDIDQMQANDIARVTVEMHYPLFGKEEFKVIPLSPRAGQFMMSDNIYVDRGTRGFAYRLIVHHKSDGRMALPWQTRVGDRYVYATLPEELLTAGTTVREQAQAAAKQMGKMGTEKVLDKFQELFSKSN